MQLRKNRDQLDWQIVYAVKAHVLKRFQDRAFAGARKAGHNDKLACISFLESLDVRAGAYAQAFTLRWWVLGIRISSRYFATVRRVTWMPASSSFLAIWSSVSGLEVSSSSIIFLTRRFKVNNDMPPPSGPFTDSLKNERSSRTPWGVCAYLLATARLTVDG